MNNKENEALKIILENSKKFLEESKSYMLDEEGTYNSTIYLDSTDSIPSELLKELIVLDDIEQSEANLSHYIDTCYHMHIRGEELDLSKEIYKHLKTIDSEQWDKILDSELITSIESLRAILVEESIINVSVLKKDIYKFTEIELIYSFSSQDDLFFGGNLFMWMKKFSAEQNSSDMIKLLKSQGYSLDDLFYEIEMYTGESYFHSSIFLRTLIDSCKKLNGTGKIFLIRKMNVLEFLSDESQYTDNKDFKLLVSDYSQDEIYWSNSVVVLEKDIELECLKIVTIK